MDQIVSSFFGVNTLVYCVIIYLAVMVFRKAVEFLASKIAYIFPDRYEGWWKHVWRSIVLPVVPFVFGVGVILLFPAYPVPAVFASALEGKMAFGLVAGGASGFVFRFAKEQLKKLTEVKEERKLSSGSDQG